MYRPNLKSVVVPVPEIIAIEVLGGGCEPPILGKIGGSLFSALCTKVHRAVKTESNMC